MCFIFTIPVHFILSAIKVFKYCFFFISFIFIFHVLLQSFKETPPFQLLPGAIPWRVIKTEISIIKGVKLKNTNLPFGSVSTFKSQMKQEKHRFEWLSPREKRLEPNQFSLIWCIWSWFPLVIRTVLGLLKWLKETCFYERKKKIIIKAWTLHERKVHIKKKGRAYEFSDKGKVDVADFWG